MARSTDGLRKTESLSWDNDLAYAITPKTLFPILAIACYWGLIFSSYWGASFLPVGYFDDAARMLCRGVGFFGQAAGLGFFFLTWRIFSCNKRLALLSIAAAVLCPLGAVPLMLSYAGIILPLEICFILVFLFALGHACLFCRIAFVLDSLTGAFMALILAFSVLFSCVIFLVALFMPSQFIAFGLFSLPFLCCYFVEVSLKNRNSQSEEYPVTSLTKESNPPTVAEFKFFIIQLLIFSIVFSVSQYLSFVVSDVHLNKQIFGFAVLLTGLGMIIYGISINRFVSLQKSMWYILPVLVIGLLPLPYIASEYLFICWFIIYFGFTFFDMMSLYHLSSFIKFNNLSILRYFAAGRFANAIGLAIGWLGGFIILPEMAYDTQTLGIITCVLIGLLVLVMCIINRPKDEIANDDVHDQRQVNNILPETPPTMTRRPWHECCAEMSREFELSPRESEVMLLLSRGRTTKYISEKLFISTATTKSHTYRIYRKMKINSQQELINMLERYLNRPGSPDSYSSHEIQKEDPY